MKSDKIFYVVWGLTIALGGIFIVLWFGNVLTISQTVVLWFLSVGIVCCGVGSFRRHSHTLFWFGVVLILIFGSLCGVVFDKISLPLAVGASIVIVGAVIAVYGLRK